MYSFHTVTPVDGTPTALQVVYTNHQDDDDRLATNLDELVEAYNRRLPPTRLVFICPSGVERRVEEIYNERQDALEGRLASASHVAMAPYDKEGALIADQIVHLKEPATSWDIDDSFLKGLAARTVTKIFDDTKTILHAPHGYVFRKPSSREEDIFVRAGNMLREPSSLPVFNYLLLSRLPKECGLIYIDSFTILSFALGLQSLVDHFRRADPNLPALAIENIHSYEISPDFRIPNEANYFILISASTSGEFARKLVDEKQADPDRIVHLLGVGGPSSEFQDTCIYFRGRQPRVSPNSTARHEDALIEIGTEEFLVAQGPPSPVPITRDHVHSDGARELHKPFYGTALKFHEADLPTHGSYSTFSISVKPSEAESSPIRAWAHDHLLHQLPASVHTLVHIDDRMSAQIASWLREALGGHLVVKSLPELKDSTCSGCSGSGSVVVVAHHDPGLEGFREANIALRSTNGVHRHFVIGYAFPSSLAEHRRLKADLRMVPGGPQYGWSEYLVLPVGAAPLHESLVPHSAIFGDQAIDSSRAVLGDQLADALIEWETRSSIPRNGLFLPRTDGTPLVLRHGSVFFSDTPAAGISQIPVYAMVSAAMQAARESDPRSVENKPSSVPRFDNNPFVRTVLDPSMFARFNDGILQASLLRSSHRSELDYSASQELSHQFTSVCQSVLVSHDQSVGDSALEFVYALATGKISLRSADRSRLDREIAALPVLSAFLPALEHD